MIDLINRQDAIDILYKCTPFDSDGIKLMERLEERINALPSADRPQPDEFVERMKNLQIEVNSVAPTVEHKCGHWIYHVDDLFPAESTQECSVCHEEEFMSICNENFCPNCGARMKGAGDEG